MGDQRSLYLYRQVKWPMDQLCGRHSSNFNDVNVGILCQHLTSKVFCYANLKV